MPIRLSASSRPNPSSVSFCLLSLTRLRPALFDLAEHEIAGRGQPLLELVAFCRAGVGTEHARGEPAETARHSGESGESGENGQAGRDFELFQVHHARAAVEAHAHALVGDMSGVTGRAGQPDHVGFGEAGAGIGDAGQSREADRQTVEVLYRRRAQARDRLRRRLRFGIGRGSSQSDCKVAWSAWTVFGLGRKPNRSR